MYEFTVLGWLLLITSIKSWLVDCRLPIFNICYGCGRSTGVKLTPCSKCNAVYFCSAECMSNSAAAGHSALCRKVAGYTCFLLLLTLNLLGDSSSLVFAQAWKPVKILRRVQMDRKSVMEN